MDMEMDETYLLTTCGWVDELDVWARGLVRYSEDRTTDDPEALLVGTFEEKLFIDTSIDGYEWDGDDDAEGTENEFYRVHMPLELRLDGITEYDGDMTATTFTGDLKVDQIRVFNLTLDDYLQFGVDLGFDSENSANCESQLQ